MKPSTRMRKLLPFFLEFRRQLGIKLLSSHKYYKKRNCMITMTIKHSTKIEKNQGPRLKDSALEVGKNLFNLIKSFSLLGKYLMHNYNVHEFIYQIVQK